MFLQRFVVWAVAAVLSATLLAAPVMVSDSEYGSLSRSAGKVVYITERTSAGTTTVSFSGGMRKIVKYGCCSACHQPAPTPCGLSNAISSDGKAGGLQGHGCGPRTGMFC